jgi:S1-C subfamily serine protease
VNLPQRPQARWGIRLLLLLVVIALGILWLVLFDSTRPPSPAASPATAPLVTSTLAPTTTTTNTTSTTIPEIEALLPLTASAVTDQVGASVAFVLTQQGTGSGVVIDEGLLVTNAHVVWPDRTVSLVFQNGATFQGRVLALDPFVDLAVIDISRLARKPPPIALGSSADVDVGDELWVVGYPTPLDFTPEVTLDSGAAQQFTDWEFTGVHWLTIDAPAIGGQSGGAVVDEYGRLVAISTFGSASTLTSIAVDDVLARVDAMLTEQAVRGLEPRVIPHRGARRSLDVTLAGAWDQQLLIGWLPAASEVVLEAPGSGLGLTAQTISGSEIATGEERLEFVPGLAFPVVVAAESPSPVAASLEGSLPLIRYPDPDHAQLLPRSGTVLGLYDVGSDRDFFYLELAAGDQVRITVESSARTQLRIYDPSGRLVAEDTDDAGFITDNAAVAVEAARAGRYIVSIQSRLSTVAGYAVVTR